MPVGTLAIVASIGGVTLQKTLSKIGDHPNVYGDGATEIPLPAATAAVSWTNGTSTVALPSGHGLSTDTYDVYWSAGTKCRYGVTGTISSNSMVLSGGAGDSLPSSDPGDMTIGLQHAIATAIVGANVQLYVANCSTLAHLNYLDGSAVSVAVALLQPNCPVIWAAGSGVSNPLAGNTIASCKASNGGTSAGVLTILSLEDAGGAL